MNKKIIGTNEKKVVIDNARNINDIRELEDYLLDAINNKIINLNDYNRLLEYCEDKRRFKKWVSIKDWQRMANRLYMYLQDPVPEKETPKIFTIKPDGEARK